MSKATEKQLRFFIKEENDTSKLYRSLGFVRQANQEREHARFFEKELKKMMMEKMR